MLPSKGKHSKEHGKPPEEKEILILDFNVEGQIRNAAEGHVSTQGIKYQMLGGAGRSVRGQKCLSFKL